MQRPIDVIVHTTPQSDLPKSTITPCVYIGAISSAVSFRMRVGKLSGPQALAGLMLPKSLDIPACLKDMRGISGYVICRRGMVSRFSAVITDVKWFTNAVALLISVAAGMLA